MAFLRFTRDTPSRGIVTSLTRLYWYIMSGMDSFSRMTRIGHHMTHSQQGSGRAGEVHPVICYVSPVTNYPPPSHYATLAPSRIPAPSVASASLPSLQPSLAR